MSGLHEVQHSQLQHMQLRIQALEEQMCWVLSCLGKTELLKNSSCTQQNETGKEEVKSTEGEKISEPERGDDSCASEVIPSDKIKMFTEESFNLITSKLDSETKMCNAALGEEGSVSAPLSEEVLSEASEDEKVPSASNEEKNKIAANVEDSTASALDANSSDKLSTLSSEENGKMATTLCSDEFVKKSVLTTEEEIAVLSLTPKDSPNVSKLHSEEDTKALSETRKENVEVPPAASLDKDGIVDAALDGEARQSAKTSESVLNGALPSPSASPSIFWDTVRQKLDQLLQQEQSSPTSLNRIYDWIIVNLGDHMKKREFFQVYTAAVYQNAVKSVNGPYNPCSATLLESSNSPKHQGEKVDLPSSAMVQGFLHTQKDNKPLLQQQHTSPQIQPQGAPTQLESVTSTLRTGSSQVQLQVAHVPVYGQQILPTHVHAPQMFIQTHLPMFTRQPPQISNTIRSAYYMPPPASPKTVVPIQMPPPASPKAVVPIQMPPPASPETVVPIQMPPPASPKAVVPIQMPPPASPKAAMPIQMYPHFQHPSQAPHYYYPPYMPVPQAGAVAGSNNLQGLPLKVNKGDLDKNKVKPLQKEESVTAAMKEMKNISRSISTVQETNIKNCNQESSHLQQTDGPGSSELLTHEKHPEKVNENEPIAQKKLEEPHYDENTSEAMKKVPSDSVQESKQSHSPSINPEVARKKYDRDFLLKLRNSPLSRRRLKCLPPLECVLKNMRSKSASDKQEKKNTFTKKNAGLKQQDLPTQYFYSRQVAPPVVRSQSATRSHQGAAVKETILSSGYPSRKPDYAHSEESLSDAHLRCHRDMAAREKKIPAIHPPGKLKMSAAQTTVGLERSAQDMICSKISTVTFERSSSSDRMSTSSVESSSQNMSEPNVDVIKKDSSVKSEADVTEGDSKKQISGSAKDSSNFENANSEDKEYDSELLQMLENSAISEKSPNLDVVGKAEKCKKLYHKVKSALPNITSRNRNEIWSEFEKLDVAGDRLHEYADDFTIIMLKAAPEHAVSKLITEVCNVREKVQLEGSLVRHCKEEISKNANWPLHRNFSRRSEEEIQLTAIKEESNTEKKLELLRQFYINKENLQNECIGNIRVISLLYKLDILPFRLIQRCLKHFTEEGSEESLECLCVLLTLLGKDLESQNKDLSEYFNEIQKLSDKDDEDFFLSRYRLKCMLQLKKNKWVPLTEEKEKEILHMCETVTKNTSINQDQMNESIAASLFDTNMSTYSHQEKAVFTTSPSLSSITSSPAKSLKVDEQKGSVISSSSVSPLAQSLKVDEQKEALVSSISKSSPVQSLKVDEQKGALVSSISTSPPVQNQKIDKQKDSIVSNVSISPLAESMEIGEQKDALFGNTSTSLPVQSLKIDEQKGALDRSITTPPPVQSLNESVPESTFRRLPAPTFSFDELMNYDKLEEPVNSTISMSELARRLNVDVEELFGSISKSLLDQNLKVDGQKKSVISNVSVSPLAQSLKVDEQKEALVSSISQSPPVQSLKVDEQMEALVSSISTSPTVQTLKVDGQKESTVSNISVSPLPQSLKIDKQEEALVSIISTSPPVQSSKVDEQKETLVSSILRSPPVQNLKVDEQKESVVSSVSIFPPSQSLKVDEQKEALVSSILRSPPVQNMKVDEQKESVVNSVSIFPPSQSLKVDEQKEALVSSILRSPPVQNVKVDEQKESVVNSVSIFPPSQSLKVDEQKEALVSSILRSLPVQNMKVDEQKASLVSSVSIFPPSQSLKVDEQKETLVSSILRSPPVQNLKVDEQKESVVNSASIFPPSQSLKVDEQKETLGSSILRSLPVQNLKVDEQKESIVNSVSISPSSQRPNVCEQTGTIVSCLSSSSLAQSPIGEKPMGVINSCAFTSLAATNLGNNAEKETVCKSEVTPPPATDMKVIENDMKKEDKPVTSACTAITESNMLHQVANVGEEVKKSQFISALVTAVCQSSLRDEEGILKLDKAHMQRHMKLVFKYVGSNTVLELHCFETIKTFTSQLENSARFQKQISQLVWNLQDDDDASSCDEL
ncbi:serine-rich adhesin for platelets-like isoform X2 [Periplaneta americana]|uniref:serine-rich adhesin for platelets-like isoform X2 n=1 Tax=Periplaneta americana TaxID=6978 RepID=UPI0037E85AEC